MPDMNMPNSVGKKVTDYLAPAMQLLKARQKTTQVEQTGIVMQNGPIDKKRINEAIQTLKRYKDGKRSLEQRIKEEEQWWKMRHWEAIRKEQKDNDRPEPTSAWLFNSLTNKHADVMDNYPEPNVLPREMDDEADAEKLASILPVIFERNDYEETYSDAAWYKLKHGVAAKGVFWNSDLEDGLGDIDVHMIDLLNIFWEPGITDIQDSRNLFIVSLRDNEVLEAEYPQLKGKMGGQLIDVEQYVYDDHVDISNKSVVVDWYYKRRTPDRKTVLHFCKFVGTEVLYASENDPEYAERGFYDHGEYPVVFDVLFPEEGTPIGFGYISVMKSPQLYIDKLSQIILENTMMATKPRYFASKSVGINEEEFLDWSKPIVHVEGNISEERFQPITVSAVPASSMNMLQMKIDELKETSSNRDVSQGSSSGGVTAAAAIAALQEAGNKTSRDMISASYRAYTEECYLAIELIRQFYDETRSFRITGDTGRYEYIQINNQSLQGKPVAAFPGQEKYSGYVPAMRKPIFDIVVKAARRSPYSRLSQNELAKELYGLGAFNPQLAEQTLGLLDMMDFDGIEKVRDKAMQGQTLMNRLAEMQMLMQKMALIIYKKTGEDVLGLMQGGDAPGNPAPADKGSSQSVGSAVKQSQTQKKGYAERLAENAVPDVSKA